MVTKFIKLILIFIVGTLFPNFVSINNAVYLCQRCAITHREFEDVSKIKSATIDNFDEEQIKILCLGGNQRLKHLLLEYSLPQNTDPNYKYFIVAVDYYRKLLQYEANNLKYEKPSKPESYVGLESLRQIELNKHEVEKAIRNTNTTPISSNALEALKDNQENDKIYKENAFEAFDEKYSDNQKENESGKTAEQEKGFLGEVNSLFLNAKEELNNMVAKIKTDIKESNIDEKIQRAKMDTKEAFEVFGKKTESFFSNAFEKTKKVRKIVEISYSNLKKIRKGRVKRKSQRRFILNLPLLTERIKMILL